MYGLISVLYDEPKQQAFERLYSESDGKDQLLLRSTVAEALKDCPRLILSHGTDWIFCTLASYHKSPDDTSRVFQSVVRKLNSIQFGLLTVEKEVKFKEMNEVADDCLVGLSFFQERVERMHRRKAAPSVDYYMKVGSLAFQRLGFDHIGEDFEGWVKFIQKEMTI
jgi:hypothetical protein